MDLSLEKYWRAAESSGDSPWAEFLRNWVIQCRKKINEHKAETQIYTPVINPEAGFVMMVTKEQDFTLRIYQQEIENLINHKIYLNPDAAEKFLERKEVYLEGLYLCAKKLKRDQNKLSTLVEARQEENPELQVFGDEVDSYLTFWVKKSAIYPARPNELPDKATIKKVMDQIEQSSAELYRYQNEFKLEDKESKSFFKEYEETLNIVHSAGKLFLHALHNDLRAYTLPAEVRQLAEKDSAKLKTGFAENRLAR